MMKKYDELILKLTLATMSGRITWEVTGARNGFQVKIGKNSVSIVCCDSMKLASLVGGENRDVQSGTLSIINSKGECIDCYSRRNEEPGFEQLRQLFVTIRRRVNKVDETLEEILKELE
jgi:hypothetical protein